MSLDQEIRVKWLNYIPKMTVGTTWGTPWMEGKLKRSETLILKSLSGNEVGMQSWPMAYWPDGSIKWSAHAAVFDREIKEHYFISKGYASTSYESLSIRENNDFIEVRTGKITCKINKRGNTFISDIYYGTRLLCKEGRLICIKEETEEKYGNRTLKEELCESVIKNVVIEQSGPIRGVVKVEGLHKAKQGSIEWLPFSIRLYFYVNTNRVKLVHSFVYDGNEHVNFIKGLGMLFEVPITGCLYNRHVGVTGDTGMFKEPCQSISRLDKNYETDYPKQINGQLLETQMNEDGTLADRVQDMAVWGDFKLIQDSSEHFVIQKRTKKGCAWIDADHGHRAQGLLFVGGENGGFAASVKNFWQKHPSSLEVNNLSQEVSQIKVWFWSPDAKSMDLRHYDTQTHVTSSYEGAEELRSTPYGIANTNEATIWCYPDIPECSSLLACSKETQYPSLLICEPEYYHQTKAFGIWSLRDTSTKKKVFIEEQLDTAVAFYINEVDQRKWYGFWNYGDFMHSYNTYTHKWKYDVGGFAWQNTELVPNMWLWYSFLRTGRADIFRLAEAMTRHTSEVDVYHIGEYRGLGSRHNVIHWGCSAKEARISMAGLHRFYYYLTADERLGDIFEEVKDADYSTLNIDPMRQLYSDEKFLTHARSGPDWSSYCSNWFTQWERFEDTFYKEKILIGINCLKNMPYRLLSGPCFGYDPHSGELLYMGEDTYQYHMAVVMGGPQVWMEMALVLKNKEWEEMLVEFGEFYYLSQEEKISRTSEQIGKSWHWPMHATGIVAYAANKKNNKKLAKKVWDVLLNDKSKQYLELPIKVINIKESICIKPIKEIPTVSTNLISQWCLNTIVCLELISDYLDEE